MRHISRLLFAMPALMFAVSIAAAAEDRPSRSDPNAGSQGQPGGSGASSPGDARSKGAGGWGPTGWNARRNTAPGPDQQGKGNNVAPPSGIQSKGGTGSTLKNSTTQPANAPSLGNDQAKKSGGSKAPDSFPGAVATDSLSLDSAQRHMAWRDITGFAIKTKMPSGFNPRVGAVLSNQVATHPIPGGTASKVPELRPYRYTVLENGTLLIINPNDKKVTQIIMR